MCAMMWILEKTLCTGKCILSVLNSFSVKKKKNHPEVSDLESDFFLKNKRSDLVFFRRS